MFCFSTRLCSARGSREFSLLFLSSKPNDEYYQRVAALLFLEQERGVAEDGGVTGSQRVYPGHEQEENVASFVVREHITPGHQPGGPGDTGPAARVSRVDQAQINTFWYVPLVYVQSAERFASFASGLGVGRGDTAEGISRGDGGGDLYTL